MSTINPTATSFSVPIVAGKSPDAKGSTVSTCQSTEAQLEIWLSSQQSPEANCAYNEISSLHFHGDLDPSSLRAAIEQTILRNASLRSTFSTDGRTVTVHTAARYSFETRDWSSQSKAESDALQIAEIESEGQTAFDLVNGPLVRFVLQKISAQHHKLTFTAHHLVMDGWSLSVFCRDLGHFYDAADGKTANELPPANQYHGYAEAMEAYEASDQRRADESYWKETFQDQIPVLDLPIQGRRPKLRTYAARRYDHHLPADIVEQLRSVASKSGCSLFNGMLAGFSAFVTRISGTDDYCIGIPAAGQAAMEQPELIGHCVNTMPLRTKVDVMSSFEEHMKSTRKSLLDAFDHQRLSFGALLRLLAPPRDPSRPPMVSVSFNVDPQVDVDQMGFDGLNVTATVEPRCFENFEWFVNGVILPDGSIELQVQFNSDLYSEEAIQFYFEGFEAFLAAAVESPTQAVVDHPTMSLSQRQQVVVDWNDTEMNYPVHSTLHEEFSRQTASTPDNIAIEFDGIVLTYREVNSKANQSARLLQQSGVCPGDLVGICVERSEQMLVNLLAIMKTGAGYVPLDPAYPTDRLQYMCDHSGLKLIVTETGLTDRVAQFGKPFLAIDSKKAEILEQSDADLDSDVDPEDVCYVIYTSGSTGKPKGVQVPHGAVVNFLYSMQYEPGFTADDSLLAVTTLSFDIAVLELYLPAISGGKVIVLDAMTAGDGKKLADCMQRHDISLLQATPATWRLLLQSGWEGKRDLKILCGGEPMPQDLVAPLLQRCGELWNMYGPTETTVWSAVYQIRDEQAPILIGKPIGNTQIYVLNNAGGEVPAGCEGEVYIGGAGVTLGYRNRDDLTAERFVPNPYRNPFVDYVSDRLYKTGDLAKYRFDGNIEFLRRNDKQVKVRGFRIELGEIEQNLKSHPAVEQTVVIVREDHPGDARLVAYLISKDGKELSQNELRGHLRDSLPHYMVPQHFVTLDALPQTNNGKIDYKQLPKPNADVTQDQSSEFQMPKPATEAERYLAEIWKQQLEHDEVFLDDTFFDIGGHSLLVMTIIATVEKDTAIILGPQDFLTKTLRQIAASIEKSQFFSADNSASDSAADEFDDIASDASEIDTELPDVSEIDFQQHTSKASKKGFWD